MKSHAPPSIEEELQIVFHSAPEQAVEHARQHVYSTWHGGRRGAGQKKDIPIGVSNPELVVVLLNC